MSAQGRKRTYGPTRKADIYAGGLPPPRRRFDPAAARRGPGDGKFGAGREDSDYGRSESGEILGPGKGAGLDEINR
jgi:hypothetical protein